MTLIDLEQETQFLYWDPTDNRWKTTTGTIFELLKIYTAYQFLKVFDVNDLKIGTLEDYGKRENLFSKWKSET
jgi:hypothetical protein